MTYFRHFVLSSPPEIVNHNGIRGRLTDRSTSLLSSLGSERFRAPSVAQLRRLNMAVHAASWLLVCDCAFTSISCSMRSSSYQLGRVCLQGKSWDMPESWIDQKECACRSSPRTLLRPRGVLWRLNRTECLRCSTLNTFLAPNNLCLFMSWEFKSNLDGR